jgi:hypothetical protein
LPLSMALCIMASALGPWRTTTTHRTSYTAVSRWYQHGQVNTIEISRLRFKPHDLDPGPSSFSVISQTGLHS